MNWSGAPAGQTVIVFGGGVDLPSNATGEFVCVAPPGSSSFTVPPTALANVPATRNNLLQSKGVVYVGTLPLASPTAFTATGLEPARSETDVGRLLAVVLTERDDRIRVVTAYKLDAGQKRDYFARRLRGE